MGNRSMSDVHIFDLNTDSATSENPLLTIFSFKKSRLEVGLKAAQKIVPLT